MKTEPRIDAYIAKAADFAQPILEHLRALVHRALPDAEEAIKWSMPHFTVNGKNVAAMAAFKAHCAVVIHGEGRQGADEKGEAMGQFGRIASLADLPDEAELFARLKEAEARVLESGSAVPKRPPRAPKSEIAMPDDFASALGAVAPARGAYDAFPPGVRRDYLEWITEAKNAATRSKRIAQAVEWIGEGKKRNWKYEKC